MFRTIKQGSIIGGFIALFTVVLANADIFHFPFLPIVRIEDNQTFLNTILFKIAPNLNLFITYFLPPFFISLFFINKSKKEKILKGSEFVEAKKLSKIILKDYKKTGNDARIFLGEQKVPLQNSEESRGIGIFAKIGAGKTVAIKNILKDIQENTNLIIYERKGDDFFYLYNSKNPNHYLFSPNDTRGLRWNIFSDIKTDGDLEFVLNCIVPEFGGKDEHWNSQARIILKCIFLIVMNRENPNNKMLIDFLIENGDLKTLRANLLKEPVIKQYGLEADIKASLTVDSKGEADNQGNSVIATINKFRGKLKLRNMYFQDGNFSVKEFIKKTTEQKNLRLFIYNSEKMNGEYNFYLHMFLNLLMKSCLAQNQNKEKTIRGLFVLDEIQSLASDGTREIGANTIKNVGENLAQLRSYGYSFLVASQSLEKLEDILNKNNVFSLLQNLSTKIILQYDSPIGQKIISDMFGENKKEQLKESFSEKETMGENRNYRTEEKVENLILGSELANLHALEAFLKIAKYPLTKINFEIIKTVTEEKEFLERQLPFFVETKEEEIIEENVEDKLKNLI